MRKTSILIAVLLASIGGSVHAQSLDVGGTWILTADAQFEAAKGTVDCQFTGQAEIMMETSSTFGGQAEMTLSEGSERCPMEMDADVDGTVDNGAIQMSMLMGPLGTAEFSGQSALKGGSLGGQYAVTQGNFSGTAGSWSAIAVTGIQPQIVPAAGAWGLALLTLLTLLAAAHLLARRPT